MHLILPTIPQDLSSCNYSTPKQTWQPPWQLFLSDRQAAKPLCGCATTTVSSHGLKISSDGFPCSSKWVKDVLLKMFSWLSGKSSLEMGAANTAPQHSDLETCKPGTSVIKLTDIKIKVTPQAPWESLGKSEKGFWKRVVGPKQTTQILCLVMQVLDGYLKSSHVFCLQSWGDWCPSDLSWWGWESSR